MVFPKASWIALANASSLLHFPHQGVCIYLPLGRKAYKFVALILWVVFPNDEPALLHLFQSRGDGLLGQQHLADKHALRAMLRIAMDLIQQKHGAVLNAVALGP